MRPQRGQSKTNFLHGARARPIVPHNGHRAFTNPNRRVTRTNSIPPIA